MPEVAANATEAVLQGWGIDEDAEFSVGDTIATVETDKAVVDVEADAPGVLVRALVTAGSTVGVGAPIALVAEPGERLGDVEELLSRLGVPAEPSAMAAEPLSPVRPQGRGRDGARIFSSPLARRLAKDADLALESIPGTGPRGRVLRRDVEFAVSARSAATAGEEQTFGSGTRVGDVAGKATAHLAARQTTERHPAGAYVEIPHSRMRQAIATRLTESKQTTPHFYLRATVNVGELMRVRAQLNDGPGPKITVTDLVVKAVAKSHVMVPELNVSWATDAVRSFASVDVAVAVATDGGLMTPVLRGVDRMSVSTVAEATRDLAERARSGSLRQAELEGGSITVTNLGMFDVEEFAAIINPPQAAILAVGAVREEPVVVAGQLAVGSVMTVTLSADHRPVDGMAAARWLQVFRSLVQAPVRILA